MPQQSFKKLARTTFRLFCKHTTTAKASSYKGLHELNVSLDCTLKARFRYILCTDARVYGADVSHGQTVDLFSSALLLSPNFSAFGVDGRHHGPPVKTYMPGQH